MFGIIYMMLISGIFVKYTIPSAALKGVPVSHRIDDLVRVYYYVSAKLLGTITMFFPYKSILDKNQKNGVRGSKMTIPCQKLVVVESCHKSASNS